MLSRTESIASEVELTPILLLIWANSDKAAMALSK